MNPETTGDVVYVEKRTVSIGDKASQASGWIKRNKWWLALVCTALASVTEATTGILWAQYQHHARSLADSAMGDPTKPVEDQDLGPNGKTWIRVFTKNQKTAETALELAKKNSKAIVRIDGSLVSLVEAEGREICIEIQGLPGRRPHPQDPTKTQRICTPLNKDYEPQTPVPLLEVDTLRTMQAAQLRARALKKAAKRKKKRRR